MAWITVKEAAKWLDISEAAVRKRIERCTLAHRRSDDGRHVYVYRDTDETPHKTADETPERTNEEDGGTKNAEDGKQNERRSWWDYIAGVSGLFVAIGGLIYLLGLFSLWAPLARSKTPDLVTAWQATSLVPRTVVAGLGVKQLVAFPLLAGVLIFIVTFATNRLVKRVAKYLANARSKEPADDGWIAGFIIAMVPLLTIFFYSISYLTNLPGPLSQESLGDIGRIMGPGIAILYGFLVLIYNLLIQRRNVEIAMGAVYIVFFGFFSYRHWRYDIALNEELQEPGAIIGTLITAALVIVAATIVYVGTLVALAMLADDFSLSRLPKLLQGLLGRLPKLLQESSLSAFLVVLSCAFLAAFILAIPNKPPLPSAQIDIKEGEDVKGMLLVHLDASWYIFEPRGGTAHSTLRIIPDEKVETVLIPPDSKKTSWFGESTYKKFISYYKVYYKELTGKISGMFSGEHP